MPQPWTKIKRYVERNSARLLFRRPMTISGELPYISFTFDDFPRTALLDGGRILNRYGASGTYYTALGLMGKGSPSGGLFVLDDLKRAIDGGHELGCHTHSHCHSWNTATDVFEDSIRKNRTAIAELLPGTEFRSFSYPISEPRPMTKRTIAKYFESCRAGGQAPNVGTADRNQLAAYFLEKVKGNIGMVKDVIDLNRREAGWLIFATHDIAPHPSPFGCTPEFFEEVVRYAVSSGAQILPVASALTAICQSEPAAP